MKGARKNRNRLVCIFGALCAMMLSFALVAPAYADIPDVYPVTIEDDGHITWSDGTETWEDAEEVREQYGMTDDADIPSPTSSVTEDEDVPSPDDPVTETQVTVPEFNVFGNVLDPRYVLAGIVGAAAILATLLIVLTSPKRRRKYDEPQITPGQVRPSGGDGHRPAHMRQK